MAVSTQIECPARIECATPKTSPAMMAQRPTSPTERPSVSSVPNDVSANIATILDALIRFYKRHQSRTALTRLTDDQLRDVGLERRGNTYHPRDEFLNRY